MRLGKAWDSGRLAYATAWLPALGSVLLLKPPRSSRYIRPPAFPLLLQGYSGEQDKLAVADRFLLKLIGVPQYRERILALALEADFDGLAENSAGIIDDYMEICTAIKKNEGLLTLLALVREIGNFVNHGGFAGGAEGFSFASLLKLGDVRGKNRMTMFNFVADQMKKHHPAELEEIEVRRGAVCAAGADGACTLTPNALHPCRRSAGNWARCPWWIWTRWATT